MNKQQRISVKLLVIKQIIIDPWIFLWYFITAVYIVSHKTFIVDEKTHYILHMPFPIYKLIGDYLQIKFPFSYPFF